MSAFDDEFGLFGDEEGVEEERRSTLGARKIATGETIIDEIEPEDERPARRPRSGPPGERFIANDDAPGGRFPRRRPRDVERKALPDEVAHPRAIELLTFLAKRLVGKPDAVAVALHPDPRGAVLELEVDPDDLGKVIGRGGRVAQALRTIVRAGAEGRVTIDIVDSGEDDEDLEDAPQAAVAVAAPPEIDADDAIATEETVEAEPEADAPVAKKKPVRKRKPKAAPANAGDAEALAE
jgi:predicted RNA-binding protein YlqC (UPF0109 family)